MNRLYFVVLLVFSFLYPQQKKKFISNNFSESITIQSKSIKKVHKKRLLIKPVCLLSGVGLGVAGNFLNMSAAALTDDVYDAAFLYQNARPEDDPESLWYKYQDIRNTQIQRYNITFGVYCGAAAFILTGLLIPKYKKQVSFFPLIYKKRAGLQFVAFY